ncbi:hypothetical protein BT93_L2636 [Corymbia citriodora subsp. variegata]|uniref:Protein RALF-like 34 n=1 Tax=Corymbia citriodora subsp. variegata TaxID=360336 RepID=A0A8T0CVY3_CORYI|nr:hypothetical protein BT93_L2636 [Corymbia citriodora subsp. variegata]
MASSSVFRLALLASLCLLFTAHNLPRAHAAAADEGPEADDDVRPGNGVAGEEEEVEGEVGRQSLFWRTIVRYYISYGALSANRVLCLPRLGRSYYTHNCLKARGPVHPYSRGCSSITRCWR